MSISKASRQSIFAKLAGLKPTGAFTSTEDQRWPEPITRAMSQEQRTARFIELLAASGAEIIRANKGQLGEAVADVLQKNQVAQVVAEASQLVGTVMESIQALPDMKVELYDKEYSLLKPMLFEAGASISQAVWGLSESGSLVTWSAPDRPRLISLVVPLHICLIHESDIRADLEELMDSEGWAGKMPTNIVLISGPSRTADIELKITLGIHGPKKLAVVIVF